MRKQWIPGPSPHTRGPGDEANYVSDKLCIHNCVICHSQCIVSDKLCILTVSITAFDDHLFDRPQFAHSPINPRRPLTLSLPSHDSEQSTEVQCIHVNSCIIPVMITVHICGVQCTSIHVDLDLQLHTCNTCASVNIEILNLLIDMYGCKTLMVKCTPI